MVNVTDISLGVLSGICLHAGLTHFIAARRAASDRLQLLFSLLCLFSVVFGISQLWGYDAQTPSELLTPLKWTLAAATLFHAVFPWFVAELTGARPRRLLIGTTVWVLALFIANLLSPYSIQYDTLPELVYLRLPWGEQIAQPHGVTSLAFRAGVATVLLIQGWVMYALFRQYRRAPGAGTLAMLVAMTLFLATAVQGILVRMSVIDFLHLGPFGMLIMIVTMSAALSYEIRQRGERVQAALRDSRALQQAILDNAGHAIISTTVDGVITSFNRTAERMLGYTAAEVIGRRTPEILHDPAEVAARARELSTALGTEVKPGFEVFVAKARGDLPNEHEWTYIRKDGTRFPVLLTVTALRDARGALTGFLGLAIDISARKRAEAALQASEERLRATLDNTPGVAVQWFDRAGRILYWNTASERLYAIPAAQAVGRTMLELLHTPAQFQEFLEFIASIEAKRAPYGPAEIDIRSVHGADVSVLYTMFMIPGSGGEPIFVCMDVDITARKQSEAELQRHRGHLQELVKARTDALEAANRELEAFSYSISHDLRAPLRAIDGFSRIVMEDHATQLDPEARHYLGRVRGAVQRMGTLIDDLLELSRVGRMEMQVMDIDLSAIARELLEQLRASEPGRAVDVTIAPGLRGRGDERLVRLLVQNLLDNAWKYTRRTAEAHIEVGIDAGGTPTSYYVRDNGAGFDMQYAHKLFQPFQRLHRAGDYEGAGVGLATVARIVHRHGGRVWVEAEVERGTTFHFTLAAPDRPSV